MFLNKCKDHSVQFSHTDGQKTKFQRRNLGFERVWIQENLGFERVWIQEKLGVGFRFG